MLILWIFLGLLAVFLGALFLRTWRFRPPVPAPVVPEDIPIDASAAVEHLQRMIRCRTVSTPELREEAEFVKFRRLLPECYPHVFSHCTVERIHTTGLLLRWKGRSPEQPAVFLSHYDVVPAHAECWDNPPFDGVLEDGSLIPLVEASDNHQRRCVHDLDAEVCGVRLTLIDTWGLEQCGVFSFDVSETK